MIENVLQPRIMENKDWATYLFIFSFALIAITKAAFETRFNDFLRILVSDKYIKVYKDTSHLKSGFTILLFIVQIISFSLFIQLFLHQFGYISKTDWILFIRIFTFFGIFVISKFLIEKIIATTFNIEEFNEQLNLQKQINTAAQQQLEAAKDQFRDNIVNSTRFFELKASSFQA
jgi:hypothetical protein